MNDASPRRFAALCRCTARHRTPSRSHAPDGQTQPLERPSPCRAPSLRFAQPGLKHAFAGVFLVALLSMGCTGMRLRPTSWSPASAALPHSMRAFWLKQVHFLPDSANHGAPTPTLVGMAYFFPDDTADQSLTVDGNVASKPAPSITVDGQIIVELYDDSARGDNAEPKPLERVVFPREIVAKLKKRDPLLGIGYNVGFPWTSYRPDISKVHLTIRFEPHDGGPPLSTTCSVITLDHSASPAMRKSMPLADRAR